MDSDHSWGIRAEMRTDETHPPLTFYPPFLLLDDRPVQGQACTSSSRTRALATRSISPARRLGRWEAAPRRASGSDVSHDIAWAQDPLGQTLESAKFEARSSDGSTRRLKISALPGRYFLKGGLYGGLNGWSHGDDKGKSPEHDVWTLAKPETQARPHAKRSCVIEVTDGDEVGYGIVEYGVGKGFACYVKCRTIRRSEQDGSAK